MTRNKILHSIISIFVVFSLLLISPQTHIPIVFAETQTMQIGFVNGSNVNIRQQPSAGSSSVGKLSYKYVYIYGQAQGTDGYEWKKVSYNNDNGTTTQGYIRSDFLLTLSAGSGTDKTFEEQLKEFPADYQEYLKQLHAIYPNWTFEADYVYCSFDDALNAMDVFPQKLVPASYSVSLRSMGKDAYNWSTGQWIKTEGSWVGASREVIAYYLDPRNFLNKTDIYMFSSLGYVKSAHTIEGLNTIIEGSFLEKGFSDTSDYNGSYAEIIMAAAQQSGVSPYMIASTIKQEQGSGTSDLISGKVKGYEGYYNFFNAGATGSTDAEIIQNGLKYAKSAGWNSRSKAIIGGAQWLARGYFSRGQNTYYYKNFDVRTGRYQYNYAQNIYDSKSSSASLRELYIGDTSSALHFLIPVYKNMWNSPAPKPAENNKKNNYYFTSLGISGFSMYKEQYSITISKDTNISFKVPDGAEYIGPASFALKKGSNTVELTVKAETGATNIYTVTVTANNACTLTIGDAVTPAPTPVIKKGDINNDGSINGIDSALIRLHILQRKILIDDALKAADINSDGNINGIDSALVRLHILGRKKIEQ